MSDDNWYNEIVYKENEIQSLTLIGSINLLVIWPISLSSKFIVSHTQKKKKEKKVLFVQQKAPQLKRNII